MKLDTGKHPTLNKFVEQLRVEQKNTEILLAQLQSGDSYEKKKYRDADEALKLAVGQYDKLNLKDYLSSIALLL